MNSLYTWLAKIGVAFIFFVILFPRIAVIIPFPETGEFTVAEIVIEGGILALMIAGLHIFLKLGRFCNLRKILIWSAKYGVAAIIFFTILGALLPFKFLFQTPYFIATGWIYYILHIVENIRFNVTEIVLGIVILALLIGGLHVFLRWFSPELKRLSNEPPTAWPLRWTLVFVAIFILMFVTGISTTASIHQLIWIAKAPKQLEITIDSAAAEKLRALKSGAKGAVSDLQGYLDSYVAGDPYIIVTSTAGAQGCVEATNSTATGKTCQAMYNEASTSTYTAFTGGITDILNDFVDHHTYKGDKSPHTGLPLFVTTHTTEGEVVLTPINSRSVSITAYDVDIVTPVFSQVVTAR